MMAQVESIAFRVSEHRIIQTTFENIAAKKLCKKCQDKLQHLTYQSVRAINISRDNLLRNKARRYELPYAVIVVHL